MRTTTHAPAANMQRNAWGGGAIVLVALGVVLLLWSAGIHLYLYSDDIRHVHVLGPLFLLQGISAIVLAVVLVITRSALMALAGAGLLAATAVGLLLSAALGLFHDKAHLSVPYAGMSLVVEFVGAAVLVAAAAALVHLKGRLNLPD